ncbi:hypothetical protein FPV67DRAFT_772567 [Lyophyllum atratum]|nr:hypothetical protein FPV67DRAFT_772567 [Lyophyllum atratum]
MFNEGERSQMKTIHGVSGQPKNNRDASQSSRIWKNDNATPISTPVNRPVRQEQQYGLFAQAKMAPNPTPRRANQTASQILANGNSSSNKTRHTTITSFGQEYVPGRGTPGARNSLPHGANVIINLESDNEDMGILVGPSTPDHLDLFDEPPSAKAVNKRNAAPPRFRVPGAIDVDGGDDITHYDSNAPSGSRSIPDGDETRALERRLAHNLGDESDPIQNSSPPPLVTSKGRQDGVREKVQAIEQKVQAEDKVKRIDLRYHQQNQPVKPLKKSMKAKNPMQNHPPAGLRDPEATRATPFVKAPSTADAQKARRQLRIKEWILGSERQTNEETYFVSWVQEKLSIVREGWTTPQMWLEVSGEVQSVEYTERGDFIAMGLRTYPGMKNGPKPRNRERFKMGDKHIGKIWILFDSEHDWSSGNYATFITWVKRNVNDTAVLTSNAARSMWEGALRISSHGDMQQQRQKGSKMQSAHEANSLKRRAPDDHDEDEVTPLPVDQLSRDLSTNRRDPSTSSSGPASRAIGVDDPETAIPTRRSARRHSSPKRRRSPTLDPDEVILCYPQGIPGAVNITNSDFRRLQPGEFLNDTLIEFGLKLWLKRLEESNPELASQVHVFSSFFYKKLNKRNADEGYESVRKWTTKLDIFSKKYIIIPINENFHWYLVIIYQPEHILIPPPILASPATRGRKNAFNAPEPSAKPASVASNAPSTAPRPSTTKPPLTIKPPSSGKPPSSAPSSKQPSTPPDVVELSPSSEAEVEEAVTKDLLNFEVSCSITVTTESTAPSRASSVMEEDPPKGKQDNMAIIPDSPLTDMEIEEAPSAGPSRELSMTVSDYVQSAARVVPPVPDVDMEDVPSASTSQRGPDSLFDGDGDVEDASLSAIIPPVNFYGKPSRKAQGKQRAIPNQAIIYEGDHLVDMEEDDLQEDHPTSSPDSENKTYIFTFDSLGSKHPQAIKQLSRYLKKEAHDKLKKTETSDAQGKQALVPVQPNFCDCGLYLLHFAETFMSDPLRYCQIIKGRSKGTTNTTRQDDWKGEMTGDMRERLGRDIERLAVDWKKDRAAREEAKRKEAPEGAGAIEVLESSDDEVDIVETTPAVSSETTKKGGKGKAPTKGKAMRHRG